MNALASHASRRILIRQFALNGAMIDVAPMTVSAVIGEEGLRASTDILDALTRLFETKQPQTVHGVVTWTCDLLNARDTSAEPFGTDHCIVCGSEFTIDEIDTDCDDGKPYVGPISGISARCSVCEELLHVRCASPTLHSNDTMRCLCLDCALGVHTMNANRGAAS